MRPDARRSVCIVDKRSHRNHFAAHSHGCFAQDGGEPWGMIYAAPMACLGFRFTAFFVFSTVGIGTLPFTVSRQQKSARDFNWRQGAGIVTKPPVPPLSDEGVDAVAQGPWYQASDVRRQGPDAAKCLQQY